jgi:CBS domain-containing protein
MTAPSLRPPASPLAGITVRNAMQLGLFHCQPSNDLPTLARMMAQRPVHCLVVSGLSSDPGGEHLGWGIVSDLDLVRGLREPAGTQTAGDIARTELIAVSPSDSLETAARLMTEHDTAHLVVASPDTGLPVGIISTLDIARVVSA